MVLIVKITFPKITKIILGFTHHHHINPINEIPNPRQCFFSGWKGEHNSNIKLRFCLYSDLHADRYVNLGAYKKGRKNIPAAQKRVGSAKLIIPFYMKRQQRQIYYSTLSRPSKPLQIRDLKWIFSRSDRFPAVP